MLTRHQLYYAAHKNDPGFMESRRAYQKKKRDNDPEYRAYLKAYNKEYYQQHKKELNEKRKSYPDVTRNKRVNAFRKKEAAALADNYIIRLLTRYGKYNKEDITPALIQDKRAEVMAMRDKKKK